MTFLPETAHHKLPDTIAEGEEMGKGDTFYTAAAKFCKRCKSSKKDQLDDDDDDGDRVTTIWRVCDQQPLVHYVDMGNVLFEILLQTIIQK